MSMLHTDSWQSGRSGMAFNVNCSPPLFIVLSVNVQINLTCEKRWLKVDMSSISVSSCHLSELTATFTYSFL